MQTIAHFMLGAALAYANGTDPLAGGSAAVAAERAAGYLAKQYDDGHTAIDPITGKFNPNLLPEHIKEEIKAQTGVIASVVGAAGGSLNGTSGTNTNALFNAQVGGVLGQNAVENNSLLGDDIQKYIAERAQRAAQTSREKWPDEPAISGFFLGLGNALNGAIGLGDASLETLAVVIHCTASTSYCQTGMANNQAKGQALLDMANRVRDGRLRASLQQWGHDLRYGTPEQQRRATEQLAEASATLGLGAAFGPKGGGSGAKAAAGQTATTIVRTAVSQTEAAAGVASRRAALGRAVVGEQKFVASNKAPKVRPPASPVGEKIIPVGESYIPSSPQAVKGTTVTLAQEQRLANGELIPKGSVVTWSDNAVKVVRPDGIKKIFNSKILEGSTASVYESKQLINSQQLISIWQNNPQSIWGLSAVRIAEHFNNAGYKATVRQSTQGSGKALIVKIEGHKTITQIQVHPGGGRHGGEYYKISTTDKGKIKIVNPKTYNKTNEKATILYK